MTAIHPGRPEPIFLLRSLGRLSIHTTIQRSTRAAPPLPIQSDTGRRTPTTPRQILPLPDRVSRQIPRPPRRRPAIIHARQLLDGAARAVGPPTVTLGLGQATGRAGAVRTDLAQRDGGWCRAMVSSSSPSSAAAVLTPVGDAARVSVG